MRADADSGNSPSRAMGRGVQPQKRLPNTPPLCSRAAAYCSQSPPGRITRLIVSTLRSSMITGAAGATRGATIAGGKPGTTKVVSLIRR